VAVNFNLEYKFNNRPVFLKTMKIPKFKFRTLRQNNIGLLGAMLFLLHPPHLQAAIPVNQIAVIVNEASAESRLVGRFYQKLRGIPPRNMVFLKTLTEEEIPRNRYVTDIQTRLRNFLEMDSIGRGVRYLVTTRGMPLKVFRTTDKRSHAKQTYETDAASLESELMNVLKAFSFHAGWQKRKPDPGDSGSTREMIVLRLDGPGVVEIKNYLTNNIIVEKHGLKGKWCIDIDNIDTARAASYTYENSMRLMASKLRGRLEDITIALDSAGTTIDGCDSAALYTGWQGSAKTGKLGFLPGSFGMALALRPYFTFKKDSPVSAAASLLQQGVSATMAHVDETYISAYPLPHKLFALLLEGKYDLGEIAGQLMPHSSWMVTIIGDPLYCPFRKNPQIYNDQVEALFRWEEGD
jgi:uncharacterized protein (TIGR03790 family)